MCQRAQTKYKQAVKVNRVVYIILKITLCQLYILCRLGESTCLTIKLQVQDLIKKTDKDMVLSSVLAVGQ